MRYLDSVFLGEPSAQDIFEKYESSCASIYKSKTIQNSCDGLHVNLKFLGILEEKRKELELNKLIFIGIVGCIPCITPSNMVRWLLGGECTKSLTNPHLEGRF